MKQLREHQPAEDDEVQGSQHGGQPLVIAGQTPEAGGSSTKPRSITRRRGSSTKPRLSTSVLNRH